MEPIRIIGARKTVGSMPLACRSVLFRYFRGEELQRIGNLVMTAKAGKTSPNKITQAVRRVLIVDGKMPSEQAHAVAARLLGYGGEVSELEKPIAIKSFQEIVETHETGILEEPALFGYHQNNQDLILEAAEKAPSGKPLVILGAGDLRGLPLASILATGKFPRTIVVDVATGAIKQGLKREGLENRSDIEIVAEDISLLPDNFYWIATNWLLSEAVASQALNHLENSIARVDPTRHLSIEDAGLVVSTMAFMRIKERIQKYLEYICFECFGEKVDLALSQHFARSFDELAEKIHLAHVLELSRIVSDGGVISLTTDIALFNSLQQQQKSEMIVLADGQRVLLTPELFLEEYRKFMEFMPQLTGQEDPPLFSEQILDKLVDERGMKRTYYGPFLVLRPVVLATAVGIDRMLLSPNKFDQIQTKAWLWPSSPEKKYLVQGIVLKKLP